jgi:hypothetical protein
MRPSKKRQKRQANQQPDSRQSAKYYRFGRSSGGQGSPFQVNTVRLSKTRQRRSRAVDVVLFITLLGLIAFNFLLTSSPEVSVSSSTFLNKQSYEAAVREEFSAPWSKTKLSLNTQKVAESLKRRFPEISKVTINIPLVGLSARVQIEIAEPVLKLSSGGQTYVINTNGVASGLASQLNDTSGLPEVVDESGFEIQLGQPVLDAGSVGFIEALNGHLKKANITPTSMTLPTKARELDLRTADQPYFVKFYLGGEPATQVGQYLATRQQFARDSITPAEYLDVRVQGKVFYK